MLTKLICAGAGLPKLLMHRITSQGADRKAEK